MYVYIVLVVEIIMGYFFFVKNNLLGVTQRSNGAKGAPEMSKKWKMISHERSFEFSTFVIIFAYV